MGTAGQVRFSQRVTERLKHTFKFPKSKHQDTAAPKNTCDIQGNLTSESAPPPTSQLSTPKPGVANSTELKDLWQAAYDQLDGAQKDTLATVKLPIELDWNSAPPMIEIIDKVVKITEGQFEEYQNGSFNIPRAAGDQINFRNLSAKVINAALSCKDFVTAIAGLDPSQHASGVWAVVSLGLTMAQNHYASRTALFQSSEFLVNALARGMFIEKEFYPMRNVKGGEGFENAIIGVYKAILLYTAEVRSSQNPSRGRRVMDCITAMTDQSFKNLKLSIDQAEGYLQQWVAVDQHLQRRAEAEQQLAGIEKALTDLQALRDDSILSRLVSLDNACFDGYQGDADTMDEYEGRCLPGTRTELLEQVTEWATSTDSQYIFWLNGMAGTGKSTISRTLAGAFKKTGILAASFFFKRGAGDCGNAKRLFTTIAMQLVVRMPRLIPEITKAVQNDRGISEKSLSVQFENLLQRPLLSLEQSGLKRQILVVIIDALDECESEKDIRDLLHLLPRLMQLRSVQLRVFLTSRPDVSEHLFKEWQSSDRRQLVLHAIPQPVIEQDITRFFLHRFQKIKDEHDDGNILPSDWPGEDQIQKLVAISVPLFIIAVTICRLVGESEWSPKQRLDDFLSHSETVLGSEMDRTYLLILELPLRRLRREDEKTLWIKEFHEIIGAIILLSIPLSVSALSSMIDIEKDLITRRLRSFKSVLNVPCDPETPVKTLHLSFREFLLSTDSCFHVNEEEVHMKLVSHCFRIMGSLKKNICDLSSYGTNRATIPSESIDQGLPSELQYSCRYWVHHLKQSKKSRIFEMAVLSFLEKHLLHWLEAMSLMGSVADTIVVLDTLLSIFQNDGNTRLTNLLHDTKRFIRRNVHIADTSPLQLYCSGLVFAPKESYIRKLFDAEIPPWIYILPNVEAQWDSHSQTLEGHEYHVNIVVFSPDGRLVASGSLDNTVRLWDTVTGIQKHKFEHKAWIQAVAFSPDGLLVASGSDDQTVCLWNTITGTLQEKFEHKDKVHTLVFSPDGCLIASGSEDKTVRLWDTITGTQQRILNGHEDHIQTVAFSPDGRLVASGSKDNTVHLWDTIKGVQEKKLEHESWVYTVVFSPDGRLLASGSMDKTLCLWDTVTGNLQHKLEHQKSVHTVAFSPDGHLVASGSMDNTVCLWNTITGTLQQRLEHSHFPNTVVFSPTGDLVMSAANDKIAYLWDPITGTQKHRLKGHKEHIKTAVFSPDGRLVASGSADNTIRLWDIITDTQQQTLKGHNDSVGEIALSENGCLVASGSCDGIVFLWDTITGTQKQKLEGHKHQIRTLVFSPDGFLLASSSLDNTVRLWDTFTGIQKQKLEGHKSTIDEVAFSPDSRLLASGSMDKTVHLWDTVTGTLQHKFEGHRWSVSALAFSPDGLLVASASHGDVVRLWDTATGSLKQVMHFENTVYNLIFSEDSLYLHSNRGSIPIDSPLDRPIHMPIHMHNQVSKKSASEWIAIDGEDVLWIPFEYRYPSALAARNGILVLGYPSGKVFVVGIRAH